MVNETDESGKDLGKAVEVSSISHPYNAFPFYLLCRGRPENRISSSCASHKTTRGGEKRMTLERIELYFTSWNTPKEGHEDEKVRRAPFQDRPETRDCVTGFRLVSSVAPLGVPKERQ